MRSWRKIENGRFTARGFKFTHPQEISQAEITLAFSDCSAKITNKGYDVFDTPALALSHPLHDQDEENDEGEKDTESTPDIVQETRQDTEDKEPAATPPPALQARTSHGIAFNPTGNYRLSPPFERSFIDLGRLMVEEGFDLVTYTRIQSLLSEDWKFI